MKKLVILIMCVATTSVLFAGDIARFESFGFSPNGDYYMFGYYGIQDKTYQAYADIYTVDVKKNDFVANAVFRVLPSTETAVDDKKTSRFYFDELWKRAQNSAVKYGVAVTNEGYPLYIAPEENEYSNKIEFRDFDQKMLYTVEMRYLSEGSLASAGKKSTLSSSFYLIVEQKNTDGVVLKKYTVGNPGIKRSDVKNYTIDRVISSKDGKSLVFVIEKEFLQSSGISIRYMVETLVL